MRTRSVVAGVALSTLATLLTIASPTFAAGLTDFDAPMLGSTASAQWSRLPSFSVIIDDGKSNFDVVLGADDGESVFIAKGPGAWGVLADSPYLMSKVSRFYSAAPEVFATTIIELTKGAPTESVVTSLATSDFAGTKVAAGTKIVTPRRESDGWTVWTTKPARSKNDPNDVVHTAYASKGREIVRVYCGGDLSDRDGQCEWGPALALHIARTKPNLTYPKDVSALAPKRGASGLKPEMATFLVSEDIWEGRMDAPRSMAQFLGENTLSLQWSVPGQPALSIRGAVTSLPDQLGLDEFLADICRPTQTCAVVRDLAPTPANGQSAGVISWPEGEMKSTWHMEFQAGDDSRVASIYCTVGDGYERPLTKAEASGCRSAIKAAAGAIFAK